MVQLLCHSCKGRNPSKWTHLHRHHLHSPIPRIPWFCYFNSHQHYPTNSRSYQANSPQKNLKVGVTIVPARLNHHPHNEVFCYSWQRFYSVLICKWLKTSVQSITRKRKAMLFELGCGSIAFFCIHPSLSIRKKQQTLSRITVLQCYGVTRYLFTHHHQLLTKSAHLGYLWRSNLLSYYCSSIVTRNSNSSFRGHSKSFEQVLHIFLTLYAIYQKI